MILMNDFKSEPDELRRQADQKFRRKGQMHHRTGGRIGGTDRHRLAAAGDANLEMVAFTQEGGGGDFAGAMRRGVWSGGILFPFPLTTCRC